MKFSWTFQQSLWLLIGAKVSIFRNNEWILIKFCLCIDIWSMLWLIHIIFPNFSTQLWPLIDFRIMFMLNILWNNWWIWSNLVITFDIFLCQNMCNNKNKHSGGVSCSACNAFIGFVMRQLIFSYEGTYLGGDKCYWVFDGDQKRTWYRANQVCER